MIKIISTFSVEHDQLNKTYQALKSELETKQGILDDTKQNYLEKAKISIDKNLKP